MAKILYVDAAQERVLAVCDLLSRNGHAVTAAGSAERAMMHVQRQGGYDVVVAHLILPSIDGAEFCRWLQRWSSLSGVPRVVFTSPEVRLRPQLEQHLTRWLPADRYIHGLKDLQELVEAVESVLGGR